MTTSPVITVTDELLAELDRSVRVVWRDDDATVIAVDALTAELRRLRAENAELAQSLAESRANDQAAMGWLTSLRWASGDRGERMLPDLVTHIEGLAKDAGRLDYMIGEQAIVYEQNGTASPTVYSLSWPVEGCTQTEWHKSARDAIDTAMRATQ